MSGGLFEETELEFSQPDSEGRNGRPPQTVGYNDIDLNCWKEYAHVETDSLWILPSRARGNGHQLEYHGNYIPQIATQTFLRYSKEGDVILDLFLGCGTSAIEAARLKRRCIGVELKADLVDHVSQRLAESVSAGDVRLIAADSTKEETRETVRSVMQSTWGRSQADLLVLHPPYADIIKFSEDPADLSNKASTEEFLAAFSQVAAHGYGLLAPGRFAIVIIGDKYAGAELVPLGFYCLQAMNTIGFRTKSIVVKNIEGNEVGKGRTNNLWRYRALRGGFYIFKHEYILILQKPAKPASGRRGRAKLRVAEDVAEADRWSVKRRGSSANCSMADCILVRAAVVSKWLCSRPMSSIRRLPTSSSK